MLSVATEPLLNRSERGVTMSSSEYLPSPPVAQPSRTAGVTTAALVLGAAGGWLLTRRSSLRARPVRAALAAGAGALVLLFVVRGGLRLGGRAPATASGLQGGPGPVTQATVPFTPADRPLNPPGRNADQRLDEAVEESFPASDPISVHIE